MHDEIIKFGKCVKMVLSHDLLHLIISAEKLERMEVGGLTQNDMDKYLKKYEEVRGDSESMGDFCKRMYKIIVNDSDGDL